MGKNTLIIVLVALAIYFLFVKPSTALNRPPARPPAPGGGGFTQGLENAAPALGKFLGGLFGGGASSAPSSSSSAFNPDFHGGVWNPGDVSSAFSDDASFAGFDSV